MKITTSFSQPIYNLVPMLRLVFYSITMVGFIIVVVLLYNGIIEQDKGLALQQHLTKLNKRITSNPVKTVKLPASADLRIMKQRVGEINQLSGGKGWPSSRILISLEKLLPKSVYLISLQHKQQTGELLLLAEAGKVEVLTQFLHRLESEKHFAEVLLVRQTKRGSRGKRRIQYELKIKERGYDKKL